ncbi:phosphotransferase enzyme family protein-like protein [Lophium mytilinum]|uniref:Phosphotransferase enzyme family protein-like protein n=1 Tax=Lophium mytilinum TaxID=390894 RepID=A0A6A6R3F4_9PEZI|nr:phosphotransferase enzyme family protein-like protein [Lophium mytilinum]
MTVFDLIAEIEGDNEWHAWLKEVLDAKHEIVKFVTDRREGEKPGEFVRYLKGSFNLSLVVSFDDGGPAAVIRFPKPGHVSSSLREEKVKNEVQVLKYLAQNTTVPVPRVTSWGLTQESPNQLGPFIIMEFTEGKSLASILKKPTENDQQEVILNPEVADTTLEIVYEQLAGYLVQFLKLDFASIGAISETTDSNTWAVTERPFTYNMNELATVVSGYPVDKFPTAPFTSASEYFHHLADEHMLHFQTQRNIADDSDDAQRRFIARHRFKQLIPQFCIEDNGPFKVFCDDMQPSNMLVNPETLEITAILDFEFTNAMPAQFSYDPPSWLLLLGPDMWLERYGMERFLAAYEPKMELFLRVLERIETKVASTEKDHGAIPLSSRMRDSWQTKRFWFDYGIRKSFDIDAVYWDALDNGDDSLQFLDKETQAQSESVKQIKMEELDAYLKDCAPLLA